MSFNIFFHKPFNETEAVNPIDWFRPHFQPVNSCQIAVVENGQMTDRAAKMDLLTYKMWDFVLFHQWPSIIFMDALSVVHKNTSIVIHI